MNINLITQTSRFFSMIMSKSPIAFPLRHSLFLWIKSLRPMPYICVTRLTVIGSENGLSSCRHQSIIWCNVGTFSIGPLGTNFSEILIDTNTFSPRKMHLKMSSRKWRPFCLGLNVLIDNLPSWIQFYQMRQYKVRANSASILPAAGNIYELSYYLFITKTWISMETFVCAKHFMSFNN